MSKLKAEYVTEVYFEVVLPVAPVVIVGEEIVVEGEDVSEEKLEGAICKHLSLPSLGPQKKDVLIGF